MAEQEKFQVRLFLSEAFAKVARADMNDPALQPLTDVLSRHGATLKCQWDEFHAYVAAAKANGESEEALAEWTGQVLNDSVKEDKYTKVFILTIGDDQIFDEGLTTELVGDLSSLEGQGIVNKVQTIRQQPFHQRMIG